MFRGNSFHTIDAKGRLIIPSRFRDVINANGENGIMLTSLEKGLYAYTLDEWKKVEAKILSLSETSKTMRRFRRFFIGAAHQCIFDKQGRILIPPTLREGAGLNKEVVLAGLLAHFEIWSRENWENEKQQLAKDMETEEVGIEISKLGL